MASLGYPQDVRRTFFPQAFQLEFHRAPLGSPKDFPQDFRRTVRRIVHKMTTEFPLDCRMMSADTVVGRCLCLELFFPQVLFGCPQEFRRICLQYFHASRARQHFSRAGGPFQNFNKSPKTETDQHTKVK